MQKLNTLLYIIDKIRVISKGIKLYPILKEEYKQCKEIKSFIPYYRKIKAI